MTIRQAIGAALSLLDKHDRWRLGLATVVQISTALFDLLGVVLLGAVGALAVGEVQGSAPPKQISALVSAAGLGNLSDFALAAALAGVAAALLLTKSVLSPLVLARVFRFLARREALISARLAKALLSQPLTFVQRRSSQETASALADGVGSATVMVLGQTVVVVSEAALLIMMAAVLLVANPSVAAGSVVFFALVGVGLQRAMGHRAARLGTERVRAGIASVRAVQEAVGAYRELTVADRRSLYVDRIRGLRAQAAKASAGLQLVNMLPKYIAEAALVLGAFALAAALFTTQSEEVAAGAFAIFIAAASRVMPSLLRLQTAMLTIRAGAGQATPTFALAKELDNPLDALQPTEVNNTIRRALLRSYPDFRPAIGVCDVSFTYPGSDLPAVRNISFSVSVGHSVALVGTSGAGKSTLADLILGMLQPQTGTVRLAGLPPSDAIMRWPGAIAYVPQEVMLMNDSVRGNVALGLPRDVIDDELVWDALRRAQLADQFFGQTDGLDTQIGERGLRLSGGQRQRLGVARALFSLPRLLVLDEATSALDAETERAISNVIDELEDDVTTVIIAHRLSTIRNVDLVVCLEDGIALAQGTFDQVCDNVPALARQATLMGLQQKEVR